MGGDDLCALGRFVCKGRTTLLPGGAHDELVPLAEVETRMLIDEAVAQGNIQMDARKYADELHRMSGANPRILEELLIELSAREYKIDSSFGLDLLDLDRRIHEVDVAIKAAAEAPARK